MSRRVFPDILHSPSMPFITSMHKTVSILGTIGMAIQCCRFFQKLNEMGGGALLGCTVFYFLTRMYRHVSELVVPTILFGTHLHMSFQKYVQQIQHNIQYQI